MRTIHGAYPTGQRFALLKIAPGNFFIYRKRRCAPSTLFFDTVCSAHPVSLRNAMKSIALIAHDGKKAELLDWVATHAAFFQNKTLYATGTTGRLISDKLQLPVHCFASGPLGGDQQIGALIAEQKIDWLVFFWDPLSSQPHDPDVKALIRLAVVWNIPVACNKATADFIVHSSLFQTDYQRAVPDFSAHQRRFEPAK